MNEVKTDPLLAAVDELQGALATESSHRELIWADEVHLALGRLAYAIQQELHAGEHDTKTVGEINSDFQNAPVVERHAQTMRTQLIALGERVHQLRSAVRAARENRVVKADQLRVPGVEIATGVKKVRHAKDGFLLKAFNTNPGAGD